MASLLHFVPVFALGYSLYSHFAVTLEFRKDRADGIFLTEDWDYPWRWSLHMIDHLLGSMTPTTTSLKPLWDNDQPDHTCDWDCSTMHTSRALTPVLCLFKPIAHIYTLKMAENGLSAYFASSQSCLRLCNKFPISAFTMPLHLAYMGKWLDLA
jgi:hypothetical protein